jgi:hypothetical protein
LNNKDRDSSNNNGSDGREGRLVVRHSDSKISVSNNNKNGFKIK